MAVQRSQGGKATTEKDVSDRMNRMERMLQGRCLPAEGGGDGEPFWADGDGAGGNRAGRLGGK